MNSIFSTGPIKSGLGCGPISLGLGPPQSSVVGMCPSQWLPNTQHVFSEPQQITELKKNIESMKYKNAELEQKIKEQKYIDDLEQTLEQNLEELKLKNKFFDNIHLFLFTCLLFERSKKGSLFFW